MSNKKMLLIIFFLNIFGFCEITNAGFFYRNDQKGYNLFRQNKFQAAGDIFDDPKWKSVSFIKFGQYDKAIQILTQLQDIDSMYNLGNAFAYSGNFDEAIQSYEKILKIDPNHEDAKYNLEIVKKIREQQNKGKHVENKVNKKNKSNNSKQKDQKKHNAKNQDQQNKKSALGTNTSKNNNKQSNQNLNENNAPTKDQNSKEANKTERNKLENNKQENSSQQNVNKNDANEDNKNNKENNKFSGKEIKNIEQPNSIKFDEKQQAIEQWLNKIPDEPGGLLKQKFLRDHLRRKSK